jgi:hypothetical protein
MLRQAIGVLIAFLGASCLDTAHVHHKVWMKTYSDADYVGAKASFRANFSGSSYQTYEVSIDPKLGEHTLLLKEEKVKINSNSKDSAKERAAKRHTETTLNCVQDAWQIKVEGPAGVIVCCNPVTSTFGFVKDVCPQDFFPFAF